MPERPHRTSWLFDGFCIALLLACVTAIVVMMRILWLDEAASDRTQALMLVVACGAFIAAFITAAFVGLFLSRWRRWLRSALASICCAGLFIPAVMACFAVENRLIEAHLEPGAIVDGRVREIIWSLIGAMGLFTPTGMRYLVPWTIAVLFVAAAVVFYRWPDQTQDHP